MRFSGSKLRTIREGREASREAVAVAVGTSAATIGNWERDVHVPDANDLRRLADFLGVPTDEFFEQSAA